ncbi:hypothetical protein [Thermobacillus composti]|uniref:hypothetical protein n=1 Tax=Thermobacillus composti TaxID=377615 RepID=UPI0012FAE732|nr:hypothetical protein [Thermobacillus composti]
MKIKRIFLVHSKQNTAAVKPPMQWRNSFVISQSFFYASNKMSIDDFALGWRSTATSPFDSLCLGERTNSSANNKPAKALDVLHLRPEKNCLGWSSIHGRADITRSNFISHLYIL